MESRPIVLCVHAEDELPSFLRGGDFPERFACGENKIVVVAPSGGQPVDSPSDGLVVCEYDPSAENPVVAVNRALALHFDGRVCDLVLVDDFDCAIDCDLLEALQACVYRLDRYSLASPRMEFDGFLHLDAKDLSVARENLPAVTRIPYPSAKFVYIRGIRFTAHGPFDEVFTSLDYAVRDFALSLDGYGYDSVMANHLLVQGATEAEKPGSAFDADSASDALIAQRYPFSEPIAARFLQDEIGPVNHFMNELGYDGSRKWRVLLDFANLPPFHCGTSETQKAIARHFQELFSDAFEVHVFTNREGAEFHRMEELCDNVHYEDEELGTYDIGLLASHPSVIEELIRLNDHCLRIVHTMMDGIMLRCDYLARWNPEISETIRLGLGNCDGIISISDFSQHDCAEYYQDDARIMATPWQRVYVSTDYGLDFGSRPFGKLGLLSELPFDDYVLLVGNHYQHKTLAPAVEALRGAGENLVVFGVPADDLPACQNVYGIPSGLLNDDEVAGLYLGCKAVVFPSVYEGFGLPIVMALRSGKAVVVNENELNAELASGLLADSRQALVFYRDFCELPECVERAIEIDPSGLPPFTRPWKDAVREIGLFLSELVQKPVDCNRLNDRWHVFACFRRQLAHARQSERERYEQEMRDSAGQPASDGRGRRGPKSLLRAAARRLK